MRFFTKRNTPDPPAPADRNPQFISTTNRKEAILALAVRPSAVKAKKPKQVRYLDQSEEHLVSSSLTRRDGRGNLVTAITDLVKGKAVIKQETTPITVDADGVADLIEFYTAVQNLLVGAPKPVISVEPVEDETDTTT